MLWVFIAVLISKSMSLLTQFFLGYVLSVEDFGVFAVITGLMALVSGFQDPGLGRLLVQKQNKFEKLFPLALLISLCFAVVGSITLLVFSSFMGSDSNENNLFNLVIFISVTLPFMSLSSIFKAKLNIDLRFKDVSKIDTYNAIGYGLILMAFAYFGARAYSFIFAIVFTYIFNFVSYWYLSEIRVINKPNFKYFSEIWSGIKWLFIGAFLLGAALRGDYLVLENIFTEEELGYYFFGFMLTANIGMLLSQGIQSVLMPSFSSIDDDKRVLNGFNRASAALVFLTGILCLGMVVFSPYLISYIWNGKWDSAILVAVVMAISLPLKMLSPLGGALLESKGKWRDRTIFLFIDAATLIMSAYLGGSYFGLDGAAYAVAIQRGTLGLSLYFKAAKELNYTFIKTLSSVMSMYIPFGIVAFIFFYFNLVDLTMVKSSDFFRLCVIGVLSLFVYILLNLLFNKVGVAETIDVLKKLKKKTA
ncbi:oligosaccharide flippase family protein [Pseudocolwellia sp. HL-MZ7]|uniref:oligosaccharide flippase family protein n=1 Tax=Pseudocolwellia sp. HL-MZ7 TaxID=3400627 RepID=UPI003CEDCCAA